MTTRDIAKKAGVSPSSVSRYFSGAENLSEEIKRKIEAVIGAEAVDQAALRKAPNLIVLVNPMHSLQVFCMVCIITVISSTAFAMAMPWAAAVQKKSDAS